MSQTSCHLCLLLQVHEEERKGVARKLDNCTCQDLASVLMRLYAISEALEKPELKKQLEDVRATLTNVLDEVHALAFQLRPSELDDFGLAEALEGLIMDYRLRTKLDADLVITGLDNCSLPYEIETALYRIIQAALANIGQHAQVSTVSVVLKCQRQKVVVIIEDDGTPVEHPYQPPLFGIKERVEKFSGRLVTEVVPNRGTSLYIELPIQDAMSVDTH